jgi:glycosyltransferase involved in cell wall biosynthesis
MKDSLTKTICFFNTNKAWGGGEKWHFSAAQEFQRRGYSVYLVTHVRSQLRTRGTAERLPTYSFNIGNLTFLNPLKVLVLMLFFRAKKIDTIIMNLPADLKSAGIAAKLAGVKKIIYRRGMPHSLRNTWLNRFLFSQILTDVVINSEEIGRSLVQGNEDWFPKKKLHLIYNGIDLKNSPDKTKKLIEKKTNEWIIGSAGRLTPQKGQKYLIELAEKLKNQGIKFRLLIAGEGELRDELTKLIDTKCLRDEVILLGHVSDMQAFMNSIDLFIFPSLFEGSANTLIETLYYEKPIIAFDVSSNPEIIHHKVNGYLARAFDIDDLLQGTLELIGDQQMRESFVKHGTSILMEKFDNRKIFEQIETTIK